MYEILLLILAIIPGIIFLYNVWKLDRIEKEPVKLLAFLFLLGLISIVPALLLESLGEIILTTFFDSGSTLYLLVENFIAVALVEEGCKYFCLKRATWKSKEFDYLFDGIIYAVCVGMGFAILENIFYVIDGGIGVAVTRAIMSIPGHGIYAIIMGHYYSMARFQLNRGNEAYSRKWLRYALIVPTLLHGFYDFCLSSENMLLLFIILVVVVLLYIICFKNIKKYSLHDSCIVPETDWEAVEAEIADAEIKNEE